MSCGHPALWPQCRVTALPVSMCLSAITAFLVEATAPPAPKDPPELLEMIGKGPTDTMGMPPGSHMALERRVPPAGAREDHPGPEVLLHLQLVSSQAGEGHLDRGGLDPAGAMESATAKISERQSRVSEVCWGPSSFLSGVILVLRSAT